MAPSNHVKAAAGALDIFRALPGTFAPRDAQDLMTYPFFSLAKSHRVVPIDYRQNDIAIRVEAVPEHGMATIWDADILIWIASQIVEARDAGFATSRLLVATPYEILTFIGRGTGARDYLRLRAAMDRLQSTSVATTLRHVGERRRHRFSWLNEWIERTDARGNPDGVALIVPNWFYRTVLDKTLVLTIDREYFGLTGGLERWLYRLVRKHAGRQKCGWRFDFRHLYIKSAVLSPFKRFAFELRAIANRQALPNCRLIIERDRDGRDLLAFTYEGRTSCGQAVNPVVLSGTAKDVPSRTGGSCYREPKHRNLSDRSSGSAAPNLESNRIESNIDDGRCISSSASAAKGVGVSSHD
jgi:plasmid replication initiation protein